MEIIAKRCLRIHSSRFSRFSLFRASARLFALREKENVTYGLPQKTRTRLGGERGSLTSWPVTVVARELFHDSALRAPCVLICFFRSTARFLYPLGRRDGSLGWGGSSPHHPLPPPVTRRSACRKSTFYQQLTTGRERECSRGFVTKYP